MKYQSSSAKKVGPPTKAKPKVTQGDKEPVQVFCRLRPLKNPSDIVVVKKIDDHLLEIAPPGNKPQIYKFKYVFDDKSNQRKVYDIVAFPLIQDLLNGQNGIIFSYGVTSSGKTHTITGTPQDPGILPRTLDTIFNTLSRNNLLSITRNVFKPDGQNGFEIISAPDAILQSQKESQSSTPFKNSRLAPRTPVSARKRLMADVDWENRVQENLFVNEINCDNNYAVFVSYIEVYNNYVYDLLDDSFDIMNENGNRAPKPKRVVEDNQKRNYVQNVREIEVRSANEAFQLFMKGMNRRRIGITKLNSESSRSHSVFSIRVVQAPLDLEGVEVLDDKKFLHVSQLCIVDLAGCERTSRTNATGSTLKETCNINNSLLTLRNCFDVLRDNQKFNANKMVPYRENKLTHLFKSYFEGDGKVEMIICINPGLEDCEETLQVCKFAELSQELTTTATKGQAFRYPFRMRLEDDNILSLASIVKVGPPFPDKYLEDPDDELTLNEWYEVVEKRKLNDQHNLLLIQDKQKMFRGELVELEREHTLIKQQNSVLQMDLEARENQLKEYENKLEHVQRIHEENQQSQMIRIQQLEQEVSNLQNRLSFSENNYNRLQAEYKNFKKSTKERWKIECQRIEKHYHRMIKEKELEIEKKLSITREKFEVVKQILNNDGDMDFIRPEWLSPVVQRQQQSNAITTEQIELAREPPVANPRYRRSLSSDNCKWIEHRPPGTLELGTVFQPKIKSKNKKSVSNLKASDFVGNGNSASKYALTHHQATNVGTVATQVFKGQVVPSSTGGAQVIFDDIETLVQTPPEQFKRRRNN